MNGEWGLALSSAAQGSLIDIVGASLFPLYKVVGPMIFFLLGSVYGPNGNNVDFYGRLKRDIERLGQPFIIGGDFNTILCTEPGGNNVDRKGDGRVPNPHNSRVINQWITEGFAIERDCPRVGVGYPDSPGGEGG